MKGQPVSTAGHHDTPTANGQDDRTAAVTTWLLFAVATSMIIPLVMTSFLGDDIFDSVVDGVTAYTGTSLSRFVLDVNWGIFKSDGRLQMPALFQYFGIFAAVPNLLAYKFLQIICVLINLGTFYVFLRSLRVARLTSLVIVALAIATLQVRVYHDPILGFSVLYQTMLEFNLISFILFARYCRTDRSIDLAASAFFFFLALFYYETSYPLAAVHVFIAVRLKGWSGWRRATPLLGLSGFFFALSLGVRHFVNMRPTADYRLGLDPLLYA
ncbi:MAG: hypothetical protein M3N13_05225, partial [Candidatus Eremiobacteraeota bacterium]|nr:hypothetical protein [Candidatus Eremiobacteraeota bacterium]